LRSIRHSKEAGRYANGIYRKADDRTKAYIEEMCEPESPIYVKEIAESLKDQVELHSIQKELEASRNALNKLKSEVTERTEALQELEGKESELTQKVKEMNEEISTYNSDMYRISTYKPIDALKQILDVLKVLGDNKLPGGEIGSEIITNYRVLNEVRKARDTAQSLWDHYNSFDSTKIGDIAERQRVQNVQDLEILEDKNFKKQFLKLIDGIEAIKPAEEQQAEWIVRGNYWIDADDYYKLSKTVLKIGEIMKEPKGGNE
jgi:DNA repair exonuclease SbcCD ATPase subunit